MENPFIYGKVVRGHDFFDRVQEKKRLLQLLKGNNNILITGDRRIGKTSLVLECLTDVQKEKVGVFYLNMDPITSVQSFVERYGALFTKNKSWANHALQLLRAGLQGFKIDIQLDDDGSPTAVIGWQGPGVIKPKAIQDILALPYELASKGRQRFIICFDEFQLARELKEINLISEMRSAFQLHDKITYIFMGSETQILNQLFDSPAEKFFNSSIKFHLGPISRSDFINFMKERFGLKRISLLEDAANYICAWADDVPANIQHLCSCVWDFAGTSIKRIPTEVVESTIQLEIASNDQLYLQIWQTIGDAKDQAILKRLAGLRDAAISSPEFCASLKMNPATVTRRLGKFSKNTRGAVIHLRSGLYVFSDPFFKDWILKST